MSTPLSRWPAFAAALAIVLAATACTAADDGLSGASVPRQDAGAAAPAAVDGTPAAPADRAADAAIAAGDAVSDTAGDGALELAGRPIPTPRPIMPSYPFAANPANPVDALGALHNEGVEALWQQRAAWTAGGRVDARKALALTVAWLCQSKAKLPTLPPWGPTTGPTIPTDPCDPTWPTLLQALPGQRTLPIEQIHALAGYDAATRTFVDAVLAEQAAALASSGDPTARIQAIVRLETGAGRVIPGPLGADEGAGAAAGSDASAAVAMTDGLAADVAAAEGVTDAAASDGGIGATGPRPIPTMHPDPCRRAPHLCKGLMMSSVARHSLAYWHAERVSTEAPRWLLLPVTPPARQAAPAPTAKPKDWGKIGKADVAGAAAGGAVGGWWGGLIGAVLFSAVEGFTQ